MTAPVITHPEADREINQARAWYDEISPDLGNDFARRVLESLELIADNPRLYAEIGDGLRRAFVRRFPYHVNYRIGSDRVTVLAVFHSHADRRNVMEQTSLREANP
jgi:plasmid stabilization system protein ParE